MTDDKGQSVIGYWSLVALYQRRMTDDKGQFSKICTSLQSEKLPFLTTSYKGKTLKLEKAIAFVG